MKKPTTSLNACLRIALLLAVFLCPGRAWAEVYGNLTYTSNNGEVTITGFIDSTSSIVIPSEIDSMPVTSIESYAFADLHRNWLIAVKIADSDKVLEIGKNIFGEAKIKTLYLGRNISFDTTDNGWFSPFYRQESLKSLTISDNVTSIPSGTFFGCSGLTYVDFTSYEALCNMDFGNSAANPLCYAHSLHINGQEIKDLIIPDGITKLKNYAFRDCTGLTSVTFPESLTYIGDYAFSDCTGLTSVTFPESLTYIGDYAFSDCTSLTSVMFPESLTSIGSKAFHGCSDLTSVTIADSDEVLEFGYDVFHDTRINTLYLGRNISFNTKVVDIDFPFHELPFLKDLTISSNVTSIPSKIFYECPLLTSVTITDSDEVLKFGEKVFLYAGNIETLYLGRSISFDILSYGSGSPFYSKTSLQNVTISGNVTSILPWAFYGCSSLTSVTFPESLTSIGSSAFRGCSGLTSVTIADSDEVLEFGYDVFYDTRINTLYLGRNISYHYSLSSSDSPFDSQTSLKNLTISDNVTSILPGAFAGCSALTSVTFPESLTSIGSSAFLCCYALTSVTIADSDEVLELGSTLFSNTPIKTLYLGRNISFDTNEARLFPFHERTSLKNVTISDNVTSLPKCAFEGCTGLMYVNFASFKSLCGMYFGDNTANPLYYAHSLHIDGQEIENLVIPDEITTIGDYAFAGCSAYSTMTLGSGLTSIGEGAFEDITFETINSNAKVAPTIHENSFSDLTKLESIVNVPSNALSSYQSKWAIFACFTSVTEDYTITVSSPGNLINQIDIDKVPEMTALKLIGRINGTDILTLNRCTNLVNLDLSEATIVSGGMPYYEKDNERFGTEDNTLGEMWSYNLTALTLVTLPNNLTTIKEYAFLDKTKLRKVIIPPSVSVVGKGAFKGCSALMSVMIADSEEDLTFERYGFEGAGVETLYLGRNFSYDSSYSGEYGPFYKMTSLKNLTISDNVTTIPEYAFRGCSALTSVTIADGDEVLTFERYGFEGARVETLYIGRNFSYDSSYSGEYGPFYKMASLKNLTISDNVTSIPARTFYGCAGLTSVTFPGSLTSIGESAFYGCTGLTYVDFSSYESLCDMSFYNEWANPLYYAHSLHVKGQEIKNLVIPDRFTKINDYLFVNCYGLTSVTFPESLTSIGGSTFKGCTGLTSVNFPESLTYIRRSAFEGCTGLTSVTCPESLTSIGESAFKSCTGLTSVTFPESLTYIGKEAFYGCSGLTSVVIPNSVTSIGEYAFYKCVELKSVRLPNSITEISESVFGSCWKLQRVNVPDPVRKIGNAAFRYCWDLTDIVLPGSLREVGAEAFYGCSKLTAVKVINPIPPVIESNTFSSRAAATLSVPVGSRNIYWIHPYWGEFATINTWGGDEESSFTEENVSYQVTSEIDQTVEVTAASLVSRIPDIIIPSEVEFQGKQYRVAGIANNGFENVPAASVSLPASIGYVGLEAFKGCGALRTVECKATVPPSVYYNSFDEEVYTTATLEVRMASASAYRNDAVWGKFTIGNLPVYVTRIELDPAEWYGEEGETFQITATVYPATAADKDLEWSSSDEEYAVVSQEGVVTILKSGECDIIARATDGSGVKAVCKLRITTSIDGVDAEQNAEMEVYNMSGLLVLRTDDRDQLHHLDKGIYIVRTGSSVRKIAVN